MPMEVLCQYCRQYEDRESMFDSQKKGKRYYHPKCWERHLKEEEIKKQDNLERDELSETIKRIHNAQTIPPFVWQNLTDLRFGNAVIVDKNGRKHRQKKGVKYSVMTQAYKLEEPWIRKALSEKSFNSVTQEMLYCMKIMMNAINDVVREQQRKKKADENMKSVVNELPSEVIDKPKFKKQRNDKDISAFLDDED